MENEFAIEVVNQAIKVTLMLAAPMLIGALLVGVLVSIFQAVTQINEQTQDERSLMIVKAHKQIFLVSNSESGIQFLSEMTDTTGLIKEGEKLVTGANFDTNLGNLEATEGPVFKIKEDINQSTPVPEEKGIAALSAKDIVKFSDELKKKAKKLKPIEFN